MGLAWLVLAHTIRTDKDCAMQTYPITDEAGNLVAFEIENVYIRPGTMAYLLSQQSDVADIRERKLFSGDDELRLAFKYKEIPFVVAEPFGDSSRYWIGPKGDLDASISGELRTLREIIESYQPPFFIKLLGDLVTFKFLKAS